jgi:hypothetical protein
MGVPSKSLSVYVLDKQRHRAPSFPYSNLGPVGAIHETKKVVLPVVTDKLRHDAQAPKPAAPAVRALVSSVQILDSLHLVTRQAAAIVKTDFC